MKKPLLLIIGTVIITILFIVVYVIWENSVNTIIEDAFKSLEEYEQNREKSAIEKAVEQTGEYYDWKQVYDKDNDIFKIVLYPRLQSSECKKTTDLFEKYINQDEEYNKYERIEIIFADHNSKWADFAVKNFEEDGTLHDHFDVVKIGSEIDGYYFDIHIPDGEYIQGYKKLEIGRDYTLEKVKYRVGHFRGLSTISCYLDKKGYSALCDFVSKIMPDCEIINLQE